jgi:hypothetical protein
MAKQMPPPPLAELNMSATPAPEATQPLNSLTSQFSDDMEIICIVRSRSDPRGDSQVYYLNQPSRSLLNQLTTESAPGDLSPVVLQADRSGNIQRPDRNSAVGRDPVVRAQTE